MEAPGAIVIDSRWVAVFRRPEHLVLRRHCSMVGRIKAKQFCGQDSPTLAELNETMAA